MIERAAAVASRSCIRIARGVAKRGQPSSFPHLHESLLPQIAHNQFRFIRHVPAAGHTSIREYVQRAQSYFAEQSITAGAASFGGFRGPNFEHDQMPIFLLQTADEPMKAERLGREPSRLRTIWERLGIRTEAKPRHA
jgi:hypothetical protein